MIWLRKQVRPELLPGYEPSSRFFNRNSKRRRRLAALRNQEGHPRCGDAKVLGHLGFRTTDIGLEILGKGHARIII